MSRVSRLEPIADHADLLETEAARGLAASLKALQTKETELEQLRGYLAEYRRRAEQPDPTDGARWQNERMFLAKLSDAVAYHEAEVMKAVERHRLEAERWRHSHQRSQALDKVIERAQREAAHERDKREQAELDELGARYRFR